MHLISPNEDVGTFIFEVAAPVQIIAEQCR
jgi:hypothetical protein